MFKLCPSTILPYILAICVCIFSPSVSQYKHGKETQHSQYIMEYLWMPNLCDSSLNFETKLTGMWDEVLLLNFPVGTALQYFIYMIKGFPTTHGILLYWENISDKAFCCKIEFHTKVVNATTFKKSSRMGWWESRWDDWRFGLPGESWAWVWI